MNDYKKYFIVCILIGVISFSLMGIFNYIVDPMCYFRAQKPYVYVSVERELKSRVIEEGHSFDGLLLGSSKVAYIQPEDLQYNGSIYNAAFSGALPEEILYFLEQENPKVKWITLGIDYFMFNEASFPYVERYSKGYYFKKTKLQKITYIASLDTAAYAFKGLLRRVRRFGPDYTELGARNAKSEEMMDRQSSAKAQVTSILNELKNLHYKNYAVSERRIEDMQKIVQWAKERNIRLIIWFSPLSTPVYDLLNEQAGEDVALLPQRLREFAPDLLDITTAYPSPDGYFKKDLFHFYPSTGAQFFNEHILLHLNKMH